MKVPANLMFPIYLLDDEPVPENESCYIIASNGIFFRQADDNGFITSTLPVEGISELQEQKAGDIKHSLPLIPAKLVAKIKAFFAEIVAKYDAESCVILFLNSATKEYSIQVPKQIVSKAGVQYDIKSVIQQNDEFWRLVPVGTIHSHCDFEAFHSGTDTDDEKNWNGIHITFGHNDKDIFTITSSLVSNGTRSRIKPEEILEGIVENRKSHRSTYYTLTEKNTDDLTDWVNQVVPNVEIRTAMDWSNLISKALKNEQPES